MVDSNFIQELFKKHEFSSDEEKNKVEAILEEVKEQEETEKAVISFTDKLNLAEQIISPKGIYAGDGEPVKNVKPILSLWYDNSGIWWKWNNASYKWIIIDETDLMNYITYSSPANTINSRERGEILQALKQVARANKPLEAPRELIQFGKEIINIETGERTSASPDYFLTNPIPYSLGKKEDTPTIDRIFKEWVGEENVLTLKQIIAYCILRDYPISRIFCFIGGGMNGKSCFLNLLKRFIGQDNCCSTELDTLLSSRFEVTRLHKKLVCQMGETNFNEISKTSILKKLTGGDLIGFEYKNKTPFEEINFSKILIATNNLPITTDKTIGFYRRWMIIDFPNQFTEKKDILAEIPEEEYENLALQCVGILMELLKNRSFHNEGTLEERMRKYEDHSNPLEKFWSENIKEDYEAHIFKHELRKRLSDFCQDNRFRIISDRAISQFMKDKGIGENKILADWVDDTGKKPYIRAWIGVKFRENSDYSSYSTQSPLSSPIGKVSGKRVEMSEKVEWRDGLL